MKKKKEFNPNKKQPFFTAIKALLRLIFHKPKKIINLAGEIAPKSILLANHSAKVGPLYLELYFPLKHTVWGAGEMLGGYKSRYRYLRNIFYIQKRGFNKFFATIAAAFEAFFSVFFYRGMRVIPSYRDFRLLGTINKSLISLNCDVPVMIFPENSDNGYFNVMAEFFQGFVLLAQAYKHKTGEDIPVYPIYYHTIKRIMCIGKPCYVNQLLSDGLNRAQIAELLRDKVNELYYTYCIDDKDKEEKRSK